MGQLTRQLNVCIVQGSCSPVELKGIDWLVFALFLKRSGITPAAYREIGKKTQKTNPSEASLSPLHPSPVIF